MYVCVCAFATRSTSSILAQLNGFDSCARMYIQTIYIYVYNLLVYVFKYLSMSMCVCICRQREGARHIQIYLLVYMIIYVICFLSDVFLLTCLFFPVRGQAQSKAQQIRAVLCQGSSSHALRQESAAATSLV